MSPEALEQLLRELPKIGTLIKDRPYRQVWRFELEGRGYYLKFYPRGISRLKRLLRGNPALREFGNLQALQKAGVASPRAVAHLVGFRLNGQVGDAVILEAIEPSVPLDRYVSQLMLEGKPIANRRELSRQIRELLEHLGKAGLGHNDLHLGNFLLADGKVYLVDGYAVHRRGLQFPDIVNLTNGVQHVATRTELMRGWNALGPGGPMPTHNPARRRQWRKFLARTRGENEWFGRLELGSWSGFFFKRSKFVRRWAPASALEVQVEDWQREASKLLGQIEAGELHAIKKSKGGEVLRGKISLGGKDVDVVVKRPFRRKWYRYVNEIGRGSRAARAWRKAWTLVAAEIPTAWPLAVLEKRRLGYVTDAIIILEHVPGPMLTTVDLGLLDPESRDALFRRAGRVLRRIDEVGLSHFDAKSSNWIVREDSKLGPWPILIDVDGIRNRRWHALGISRLLRSMEEHPLYSVADSLALCQGYSPFSRSETRQPK